MAASLGDFFDGAQTTDATSAQQAITAGDYVFAVQGVFDGARLVMTARSMSFVVTICGKLCSMLGKLSALTSSSELDG